MLPLFVASNNSAAEKDQTKNDPAAENWYQVEVILFDQKTITGSELAPKEIQIGFPSNWLELSNRYPSIGIMRRPIFDVSATASINNPQTLELKQRLSDLLDLNQYQVEKFNDGTSLIPEATIPYQYADAIQIAEIENTAIFEDYDVANSELNTEAEVIDFKPVYEQQFHRLNRKHRDLNDTARGLNRRNYRVRFHEAWRFQIGSKEQSPWILVNTKKELANRQVIEGSLRFYKSRYLHFETDLWRINFSPTETMDIVLPETPLTALNSDEISLLKALRFSNKISSLSPSSAQQKIPKTNLPGEVFIGVEEALEGYSMNQIETLLNSQRDTTAPTSEVMIVNNYPIKEIWPIKQSKRIQLDEVYYIDHPHMGALISIKSFEPVPINLPPLTETAEDSDIVITE
jgi:hypothetical protein